MDAHCVVICLSLSAVIFIILSSVMKAKPSVSTESECGRQLVIMNCVSSY